MTVAVAAPDTSLPTPALKVSEHNESETQEGHVIQNGHTDQTANVNNHDGDTNDVNVGSQREFAIGEVKYCERPEDGEDVWVKIVPDQPRDTNIKSQEREIKVHNVRVLDKEPTLEKEGFVLRKLHAPPGIDWQNSEQVEKEFYPEVAKVLKEATGATRVHLFDHTLRQGAIKKDDGKILDTANARGPVAMAHVDYTHESGIDRLNALLPDEAEKLRETPFAVIQVWRPFKTVKSSPLGVIDASTVDKTDLTVNRLILQSRTGFTFAVHYNPKHKWYFADEMQPDEAYIFVCYDSRLDRARFTPHSGFRDLSIGEDAPPRESMELRSYVFWENEAPQAVQRVI